MLAVLSSGDAVWIVTCSLTQRLCLAHTTWDGPACSCRQVRESLQCTETSGMHDALLRHVSSITSTHLAAAAALRHLHWPHCP